MFQLLSISINFFFCLSQSEAIPKICLAVVMSINLMYGSRMRLTNEDFVDIAVVTMICEYDLSCINMSDSEGDDDDNVSDHRLLPRAKRRAFHYDEARGCMDRDFFGPYPLFDGREFLEMFRVSKPMFDYILNKLASTFDFFKDQDCESQTTLYRRRVPLLAKLCLPLKALAFGVNPSAFRDYFQMSKTMARCCFDKFIEAIDVVSGRSIQCLS